MGESTKMITPRTPRKVNLEDFDIYYLMNQEEKEQLTELLCEVVARSGYSLDYFDYDIKGTAEKTDFKNGDSN
tara:strand:+ start:433 stop:651 length:219 start_codon:yes stop_codon:yes gene_type:complete